MGCVGEGGGLEVVEDDVVRRVVGLADLLQDHAALALQLLGGEGGVGQDVADDVGGERQVLLQDLAVVGGLLARGVGVEVAADVLDLAGDGGGVALLGALEGHVLEEVGDAVLRRRLVAGAGGDVGAEGDGLDPRHGLGDDGQAVGQAGHADGVGHCVRGLSLSRGGGSVASGGGGVAAGVGADAGFHLGEVGGEHGISFLPFI